ncbi:MAG: ABC transporter permease, partial [Ferrovibrionaceae bacterium]
MAASSQAAQGRLDLPARVVLSLAALAAAWLVLVPLAMLLFSAFRGPADFLPFEDGARWVTDNVARLYLNPGFFQRLLPDTAISVLGTVALTTMMAFTLAWAVERTDCPGRELIGVCVLFPMLVPVNVLAVAWIYLMGPNAGWINLAIRGALGLGGQGPVNVFSMAGLILCQSLALTPYMFLLLAPVLRTMNPSLEEASAASGAAPGTTFRRITLPILMPGILAPVILATIITLEQFELPLMIGLPARLNIFSYRIYQELNPADGLPNYGGAAAVSLSFLGIAAILLWLYNRAIRRADRFVTMTGKA